MQLSDDAGKLIPRLDGTEGAIEWDGGSAHLHVVF